jgi:ActR/RegA family two-component response regulator
MMGPNSLTGRRVLLVEDDYFIADELRRDLAKTGAEVLGPVGRVDEALALIGRTAHIDGAVLDIKLHDEMVYPVADALLERGVPFVFATGYDKSVIPAPYAKVRQCEKPFEPEIVAKALFG